MELLKNIEISTENDVADIALAQKIWEILNELYPGHPWAVWADHRATNGTCDIKLFYPNSKNQVYNYGYKLHIKNLDTSFIRSKVMRAGGELLERYGLAAARADGNSTMDAREHGLDKS